MANQWDATPRMRLGAGTAFKAGFFGALGVFVFYLLVTIVLGILALIGAAAGLLPFVSGLFGG